MRRLGFTLVELLVVISVIIILMAIAIPAYGIVRRQQKAAQSRLLLTNLTMALASYLADHGVLGDLRDASASDFCARPLLFLTARPSTSGRKVPYLEPLPAQMRTADGAAATLTTAALLLDPFANPVQIKAVNRYANGRSSGTYDYTSEITLTATVGTPDDASDDLILHYRNDTGEWASEGR